MSDNYMHLEQDYDGNYYYFDNSDVVWFTAKVNKKIDKVFKKHLAKVDTQNSYYVLGNKMFFTYNGKKYKHGMTSFDDEINYVNDIAKDLREIKGISDIVYVRGYLD